MAQYCAIWSCLACKVQLRIKALCERGDLDPSTAALILGQDAPDVAQDENEKKRKKAEAVEPPATGDASHPDGEPGESLDVFLERAKKIKLAS